MIPVSPLAGIRVVCLAIYVPGPTAAARLAQLGADVTKVETPGGDPLANWCPTWYAELSAAMRVRRLDLKAADDRAAFGSLLTEADLLLTAIRPGALDRVGLDWRSLQEQYPRLCHVAIVGHAEPDGEIPGHDLTYQASVGLLQPPHIPRTLLADLAGAERAAAAALALLLGRERGTGAGRAEVSLVDAAHAFAAPFRHGITRADAILGGGSPSYALYEAREGWVALAALEPHFWWRLLSELGLAVDAGREHLEASFRSETATHWAEWAMARGIPLVALRDPR